MIGPEHAFSRCAVLAGAALGAPRSRRAADAAFYLAHVEGAAPLRRLAEATGRPLSSIHRAVRRVEAMRDDPLLDHALERLAERARALLRCKSGRIKDIVLEQSVTNKSSDAALSEPAERALAALSQEDAFLIVASGAERAGVFSARNAFDRPVALLSVDEAAVLAARELVRARSRTPASTRYGLSAGGRDWLRRRGRSVAGPAAPTVAAPPGAPGRTVAAETPLAWLARRRGPNGDPFLTEAEIEAGERLGAEYAAARLDAAGCWPGWDGFADALSRARSPERLRLRAAVEALGPGLADVAVLSCCLTEGLEAIERRFGWSARSGKVVLKIALERLARHYAAER